MHALHASLANEIPDCFKSHAPVAPLLDAGVVFGSPPFVSGSGPSVVDVECFDAHALSASAGTRKTTPHDIHRGKRILVGEARDVPPAPA